MKVWRNSFLRVALLLFGTMVSILFLAQTTNAQSSWTSWLDRDNPSGSGDWENKAGFGSQVCSNPTAIQARVVGGSTIYTPGSTTPDTLSVFSASGGLVCLNADQSGSCSDYQVRFYCPAPPPPLSVNVNCNGIGNEYICTAYVSGGSGSYGYSWNYSAVQNVIFASQFGNSLELILSQPCNPNYYNTVSVNVTDNSTGATSSDWTNLSCSSGGPLGSGN